MMPLCVVRAIGASVLLRESFSEFECADPQTESK
jgi:hypothetical protein